jgi:hypothetical protein
VVTLRHRPNFVHHNVGRFRISVTDDPTLARQTPPTAALVEILGKTNRSQAESKLLDTFRVDSAPEVVALRAQVAEFQKTRDALIAKSPSVMVMKQIDKPRPDHILKRGDFRTPGDPVEPAAPKVLGGAMTRPDRLGFAEWLVSPSNPLTARVEVNRLWEQCFGRGLVATAEDFGNQGDPPSHPELLDWLATEFIAKKWNLKAMLRLIVTSATYRQQSVVKPDLLKMDPYNVLLARGPRFRVEAEAVRDVALAASGRLTPTIGGPSVMPPQPPGIWENSFTFYDTKDRWVDETGPNRYRRGLYTFWRRTAPFPMALTFDLKSRDTCQAKRGRTNTPLQALNTLNDPLFVECAGALGETMAQQGDETNALVYGFRACTSRRPTAAEIQVLGRLLQAARVHFRADPVSASALLKSARTEAKDPLEAAAWTTVANTLLNLDETITKG